MQRLRGNVQACELTLSKFIHLEAPKIIRKKNLIFLLFIGIFLLNSRKFLKIKENLAVKIIEIVENNEAGFAFPSQSLYVEKLSDEKTEIFNPQSTKN